MSIFRIPLNAFVVAILLKVESFGQETVFLICAVCAAIPMMQLPIFSFFPRLAHYAPPSLLLLLDLPKSTHFIALACYLFFYITTGDLVEKKNAN
jgi:hypothetical protein